MTVIVGYETVKGTVILGGDSCASADDQVWRYEEPKVFINGDYVIGASGSWRLIQLLRYVFVPPGLTAVTDELLMPHMVNRFVPRLKNLLDSNGIPLKKDGTMDSSIMVGANGNLFEIDGDFHVGRNVDGYGAIGSGAPFAVGAFHASLYEKGSAYVKVETALAAAEHFCSNVLEPFHLAEA